MNQEQHDLVLMSSDNNVDTYECPVCHRTIIVQQYPKFRKIVVEKGNEYAIHTATKGDISFSVDTEVDSGEQIISDELIDLLNDLDFLGDEQ